MKKIKILFLQKCRQNLIFENFLNKFLKKIQVFWTQFTKFLNISRQTSKFLNKIAHFLLRIESIFLLLFTTTLRFSPWKSTNVVESEKKEEKKYFVMFLFLAFHVRKGKLSAKTYEFFFFVDIAQNEEWKSVFLHPIEIFPTSVKIPTHIPHLEAVARWKITASHRSFFTAFALRSHVLED